MRIFHAFIAGMCANSGLHNLMRGHDYAYPATLMLIAAALFLFRAIVERQP